MECREDLLKMFDLMNEHFGDLHWWPADTPLEVMVGAILTQNTAWANVEKAISRMRERDLLTAPAIDEMSLESLADVIRPSGCYRVKAARLKGFVRFFLDHYSGDPARMCVEPLEPLRKLLLAVKGIGPETADAILLYGCGIPSFVSDAYTERILGRHRILPSEGLHYHQIRDLFMANLPHEAALFKQYHALMVSVGKIYCRTKPQCTLCPLNVLNTGEMAI